MKSGQVYRDQQQPKSKKTLCCPICYRIFSHIPTRITYSWMFPPKLLLQRFLSALGQLYYELKNNQSSAFSNTERRLEDARTGHIFLCWMAKQTIVFYGNTYRKRVVEVADKPSWSNIEFSIRPRAVLKTWCLLLLPILIYYPLKEILSASPSSLAINMKFPW